jgi:phosphoserine aminotransferase
METRAFNFSAGPAGLPLPVLEKVQSELLCYPGAGASVMEISHRSKTFDAIHARAKDNIKQLLNLPDNYHVLFCQGGATLQFTMLAMNLLGKDQSADYINCGTWAKKAIGEAKKHGKVRVCWNGEADRFSRMPLQSELDLDPNAAYLHMTSNETIEGVECFEEPQPLGNVPLVCDGSSNFLSRPIDINKYGLLYAGAQKNIGPAGVAVAIIREDLLERTPAGLPSLLDYKLLKENDSLYNTPPCFAIYLISLTTQWILDTMGGLDGIAVHNAKKAKLIYDAIDSSGGYYKGHAQTENRSLMNVTFVLANPQHDDAFVKEATAAGLQELKGHRSVGGFRASIYNAMPLAGCEALAAFMKDFQQRNG